MILRKIGQFIGLFASVAVLLSAFLAYVDTSVMGVSVFSMSLFQYDKRAAIIIVLLSLCAFTSAYFEKGALTIFLSLTLLVGNLFFYSKLASGDSLGDEVKIILSFLGELDPGIGFLMAMIGTIVLFFAGILMQSGRKSSDGGKRKK